jgi:hypothetical protein
MASSRIKTLEVLCTREVQAEAQLQSTFLSFMPTQITQKLIGAPTLQRVTVLAEFGKVILQGLVPVQADIMFADTTTAVMINIPFQVVLECSGVKPDANIQLHDVQVALIEPFVFLAVSIPASEFEEFQIVFKAVLRFCAVVSQEMVLKINA